MKLPEEEPWPGFYLHITNKIINIGLYAYTVRPLLSAPLLSADVVYPRFLRSKLSTLNLYEIQSNLYYSHLYYPRFLRPKFSTPKYRK